MACEDSFLLTQLGLQSRCPAYCDCEFPQNVVISNYKGHIPDLVKCRCGEQDETANGGLGASHGLQWKWQNSDAQDVQIDGRDITFHPTYSQGTAMVRGERALKAGYVHFWEMRVLTTLSGTDVMFGVGTDKVKFEQFKFQFISALGTNAQSWGFSYAGKIQHNGIKTPYSQKFSQGCIVGVYLDRIRGYLEFFLNRRSLGIAFTNIPVDPSVELYPMVCSTTAQSAIRLMNSTSQPQCLQLYAFKALSQQPKALEQLRQMPGFRSLMRDYWFLAPPTRYSSRSAANEYDIADEAVLPIKKRRSRKQKYKEEEPDINDLYANAHKIAVHRNNESDDEFPVTEYFDEYFHFLF